MARKRRGHPPWASGLRPRGPISALGGWGACGWLAELRRRGEQRPGSPKGGRGGRLVGSGNGKGAGKTGASEVFTGVPVGCLGLVMHNSRGDDMTAVAHAVSAKKPPHDGRGRDSSIEAVDGELDGKWKRLLDAAQPCGRGSAKRPGWECRYTANAEDRVAGPLPDAPGTVHRRSWTTLLRTGTIPVLRRTNR